MTDTDPSTTTGDTTAALEFGPEEAGLLYAVSADIPEQIQKILTRWPAGPSLPSDVAIDPRGAGVDVVAVWAAETQTVAFTIAGHEEVSSISLDDFEETFRSAWDEHVDAMSIAPSVVERLREIVTSSDLSDAVDFSADLVSIQGRPYSWDPDSATAALHMDLVHPDFSLGEGTGTLEGWVSATAGEDRVRVHLEGDRHPDGVPMPAAHAADLLSKAYLLQTGIYHENHPTAAVPDRPLTDLYTELTGRAEQVAGEVLPEALREGMEISIDYERGTAWVRPAFMRNSTTPVAVGVTSEGAVLMVEDHHEVGPGEVIDPGPLTLAERAERAQQVSAGEARWEVDSALLRNSIDPVASAYAGDMGPQATQEAAWGTDQARALERRLRAQATLADADARIEAFDVVDRSGRPARMIDIRGGGLDARVTTDGPGQVRVFTPDGGVEAMPAAQLIERAGRSWPDTTGELLTSPQTQAGPRAAREPAARAEVTVYTTPGCVGCTATKKALDKAGVAYETIDLSSRPDLVSQFRAEGLRQAPIIEAPDGTRTSGFNPDRIKSIVSATTPLASRTGPSGTAGHSRSSTPPQHTQDRRRGMSL